MNTFYAFLTALILTFTSNGDVPYSAIDKAIESNDAKLIVELSKEKVLINVLGSEGVYGHAQAELVLKGFFNKHPWGSFDFTFKGTPTSDGAFAIGNYVSGGDTYRITLHFQKISGNYQIESFTVEK